MAILGKKFNKRFQRLGRKVDTNIHKLGQKTNNVLGKVENVNRRIIDKSGKALDVTNKVLGTADKVVGTLNDAGVRNVPLLGTATSGLEVGLHEAHKGTKKLGKLRDKYEQVSERAIRKGQQAGSALEKHNTRKALADLARDQYGDSFV